MYEFSFGNLFVGLLILIAGTLVTVFHQKIGDNFASGVSSYKNIKLFGLAAVGLGFIVALSVHTLFLNVFVSLFFRR